MDRNITPEQMEIYKRTARARQQAEKAKIEHRRQLAWKLAKAAADLLRQNFGVTQISVFGSLVSEDSFHLYSDIDLAAWGLTSKNWLHAMSAVRALSNEIEINLVDITTCSQELLKEIEREGKRI